MIASGPYGVMCVDDNNTVAEALRCRIEREPDMRWLGHLTSADTMIADAARWGADVILLDLDMPGKDPLAVLGQLGIQCPGTRAIMLSGFVTDDFIDRAIDAGAWGYVSKNEGPDAIILAVRQVMTGQIAFGPDVSRQYLREALRPN
jgi:DNA-binding NarL/FixJ family response regulator